MFIFTPPTLAIPSKSIHFALGLALLALPALPVLANQASDRAFSACVTAADAYFAADGNRIASVIVEAREGRRHRLRLTSTADQQASTMVVCTAEHNITTLETLAPRVAANNLR